MEITNCSVCSSNQFTHLLWATDWLHGSNESFEYVRCVCCGLVYIRIRPTEDQIVRYYPENSYYTYQASEEVPSRSEYEWLARRLTTLLGTPGSFIDIGCGDGSFLAAMQRNGWSGVGTEVHAPTAQRLRDMGYTILSGKLRTLNLPSHSFNLVSMLEVLEHIHNPLETLQEARRLLTPGGRLFITTPNIESLEFRLYGGRWVAMEPPIHLQLFSPKSLTKLLNEAGFSNSKIKIRTSAAVEGLTRSLWLAIRSQKLFHSGTSDFVVPKYEAKSWRRTIHRRLNLLLSPLGLILRGLQLGPGLEALAYRE